MRPALLWRIGFINHRRTKPPTRGKLNAMEEFAKMLTGGDRRSIGKADAVVAIVRGAPQRFEALWACLRHADPLVRMRASDAIEKLTRDDPAPLAAHKADLIGGDLDDGTKEMAWHLAALLGRLILTREEARAVFAELAHRMDTATSRIVQVMALQAASDLAARHPQLQKQFQQMLAAAQTSPAASLRARARKLSPRAQNA